MTSGYVASLSFGQRQIRFLELLHPERSSFALPLVIEITGPAEEAAIHRALQAVIDRHDALRASFPMVDQAPVQAVRDGLELDLTVSELPEASVDDWHKALVASAEQLARRPFDLANGPLIRSALLRSEDRLGLIIVVHHIVADGASLAILIRDLVTAYDDLSVGRSDQLPELPLQYPDFADWEQDRFASETSEELSGAIAYWRDQLGAVSGLMDLPFDRARQSAIEMASGQIRLSFDSDSSTALTRAARHGGTTTFIACLTVFVAALGRWSGLDDVVVATPISKRTRPELADLVGLFVDTLPIRAALDATTTFDGLLAHVHRAFLAALEHRDVPFERIVQELNIERRADVVPLMQVLFGAAEETVDPIDAADGVRFTVLDEDIEQAAKADLSVVYHLGEASLDIWCRYDAALFDRASIASLLECFGAIAAQVGDRHAEPIQSLPLISEVEGRALLAKFNNTTRPYPSNHSVIDLFYDVAKATPEAIAVEENGVERSYAEVADRASRLATVLAESGVHAGQPVVLAMPLSASFVELMLAILTVGAVYAPVDPNYPEAHRNKLVETIDARHAIVADGHLALGVETVLTASELSDRAMTAARWEASARRSTDAAYIMFTSGSTGIPKGVAVPHRAIARLVKNSDFCSLGPATRSAAYSNPSFDASTLEVWGPLLNGGTVVPVDRTTMMDAVTLRTFLATHRITLLWMTAGLFQQIATADPGAFAGERTVLTGGDVVNPDAARTVLEASAGSGLRLLNGYGPTENTVFSTVFDISELPPGALTVAIGRPIANSTAYVLSPTGQPLPLGILGEICVGGDGVALGYVGDPGRTAAQFPPDPFAGMSDARMYRTGDLGRWRGDGTLQIAGRADNQVKVRGFRVELNEIAAALGQHPDVGAVTVVAPRRNDGVRDLLAYFVPAADTIPSADELRAHLRPILPAHMLPHAYMALEALPLTINGKVDRAALPPIEAHRHGQADEIVAPRSEEEERLAAIWRDLLGTPEPSVRDNFFHVGGDSIMAIRLVSRALEAGLSLSLKDVFEQQTIERLAAIAVADTGSVSAGSSDQFYAMDSVPLATDPRGPFGFASLVLDRPLGSVELGVALEILARRHDGLRLRVVTDGVSRRLAIADFQTRLPIRVVAARSLDDASVDDWINQNSDRLVRDLDLTRGVAIVSTLVDRGPGNGSVVVLAMHRAIADDRSLALVAAELEAELRHGSSARQRQRPAVSLADWIRWLDRCSDSVKIRDLINELEAAPDPGVMPDFPIRADRRAVRADLKLDKGLARALTETLPNKLGVAPVDGILAALHSCVSGLRPGDHLHVEAVDSHRVLPEGAPAADELVGNLDVAMPVRLTIGSNDVGDRLAAAKIARQAYEAIGPVYRALRTTMNAPAPKLGLAWLPARHTHAVLQVAAVPEFCSSVEGALIADLVDGDLHLRWLGSELGGGAAVTLRRVAEALKAIAAWAELHGAPIYTPDDFPLAGLKAEDLDQLVGRNPNIQDIYPLSPMQESMLVHSLATTGTQVNFEQSCMRFVGPLDISALQQAWSFVFDRHPALRTDFHWRGLAKPLQIVRRSALLPFQFETWPAFDDGRLQALLDRDRAVGFELDRAPLARLHLIQVARDETYLITSVHHLLVDGWCLAKLEWEVRAAYEAFRSSAKPSMEPVVRYRDYIAWLSEIDRDQVRQYFRERFREPPHQHRIRPVRPQLDFATARLVLDPDASRLLNGLVRRRGVTIGAVAHVAWGLWSAASRGQADTVFCTTVSGRPPAIPGVERIVGLLINNLPVRLQYGPRTRVSDLLDDMTAQLADLQSHAYISPLDVVEVMDAVDRAASLFDTLVVVENVLPGTSAWNGADDLKVEAVHTSLKTAYDLTFVLVPGDRIALSLVLPDGDGTAAGQGDAILNEVAAILVALASSIDAPVNNLPLPQRRTVSERTDAVIRHDHQPLSRRPRSTLEAIVAETVADFAETEVDLADDLPSLGLSSLAIVSLAARLGERLGRTVPMTVLLEPRPIAELAAALGKSQAWDAIVPMAGGAGEPFVCVHPIAGDVSAFLDLARVMPPNLPLWAVQAPGLEPGQSPSESVEALAAANLEALEHRGLPAPRWLGGYSFGGIVAFEMARQLAAVNLKPERVVIIDTPAPLERHSILSTDPEVAEAEWLVRMADVRARFHGIDVAFALDDLMDRDRACRLAFAVDRLRAAELLPADADIGWMERAHRTGLTNYQAFLNYAPDRNSARSVPLGVIRASTQIGDDLGELAGKWRDDPTLGWSEFADGPIATRSVEGDHITILTGAGVAEVARAIAAMIRPDTAEAG